MPSTVTTAKGTFIMVFSSTIFLFIFLPLTLLGYYLMADKFKNYWLLLVSLLFFSWSQPYYLWIIILNIIINYCCAMLIDNIQPFRKSLLITAILANLGILYYFKYFDFTIDSLNNLLKCNFSLQNIILPIGISFFTFQGMSYVIDVYRREVPVQKNVFKVALYIVLFPQLIAGPIVRYTDINVEIDSRTVNLDSFVYGIQKFIIGMGKKAVLANTLAVTADAVWNQGPAGIAWNTAWIGSLAYTLQIYFDFSGYSDMAIGLGRMFGFHFNENFELPYISKNITEFWRRWHISLSSWFRDYVYIPLGGNRRWVYRNLAIVFLLTGIWHGASWHFLVWGVWNGLFILIERFLRNKRTENTQKETLIKTICSKIYALSVIHLGWILFRAPDTKSALQFVSVMLGIQKSNQVGYTVFWYLDKWTIFIMFFAVFFSSSIPTRICKYLKGHVKEHILTPVKYIALLLLFYISILRIVSGTYNPFIYFQF